MRVTPDDLKSNSPTTLSIVELKSKRDLDVFRKIYSNSFRIGEARHEWEIKYGTEFHMTADSKLFPPLQDWESKGYKPDAFGRWVGPNNEVALPLYEGAMLQQFDFSYQGWVSGLGSGSLWAHFTFDRKTVHPRFLMGSSSFEGMEAPKISFRDVARDTHTRTMIAVCLPGYPCGHTISTLRVKEDKLRSCLVLQAYLDSFCFDYIIRIRNSGKHQSWFVVADCPIPRLGKEDSRFAHIVLNSGRLTFVHRRFAPEWLALRQGYETVGRKEWKHWWAVTEADRFRLRAELDALCADLYGLEPDDFDWIVRDDRNEPKGFYRADRQLPFPERLTGLAAAAFRALKERKWSAESAPSLSNDEFFETIGIPELTNAQAAHAKGLPGPLIQKRDGCHVWKPEDFPSDDPRHGWTWDDCWEDAVALLGSEDAVEKYIAEKPEAKDSGADNDVEGEKPRQDRSGPTDLFGNPIPTDMFGNEVRSKKIRRR